MVSGVIAMLVLFAISSALAAGGLAIPWWTADGGGGDSSGGPYALSGTIGQPDAGVLSGGDFALSGGFWVSGGASPPVTGGNQIYLPLVSGD